MGVDGKNCRKTPDKNMRKWKRINKTDAGFKRIGKYVKIKGMEEIEFFIGATTAGAKLVSEKDGVGYFWKVSPEDSQEKLKGFLTAAKKRVERELKTHGRNQTITTRG